MFLCAMTLASCATSTSASSGSASTTSVPTDPRTITVTQAGNGHTYSLHSGDRLSILLAEAPGYTWTEPASSDDGLLQRTLGGPGIAASATFVARKVGHAVVTATDNPNCYPQCLISSRQFEVSVSVTG